MLVFVIPIKSPQVATSWLHLCKLFTRSLRSVCNQTSPEFRVMVVCNEKPTIDFHHPHVTYLEVDFPIPAANYGAKGDDKSKKVVAGLLAARDWQPTHMMIVDPDDCVSKNLAAFVRKYPQGNGWYVDQGYEYNDGSNKITFRKKDFYRICGTCNIINYSLLTLPKKLPSYEEITFDRFLNGHPLAKTDLAERGKPMDTLPFTGAVFIRDRVGESISMQEPLLAKLQRNPKEALRGAKKLLLAPFQETILIDEIREEFGLY